ncbi:maleylpyruvate isomerase family mycothiol-dependent enzyme [Pseudarthrobacter sp. NIBRBAC000502772]|uniref:maleylpyruvate isomerase family mycothiol-dependent enzyme n=1 Tax=Pseudarthrobacter sp. NIBRBAC000502772 TaxID=2590775 RepID=UPI0011320822|nr:maleylpyruvate isomerase family mycothiol-dependent enzyme [Pseudarthrobacter sp. NIBRBAC000502772]QDG65227.1 maleylpyruvate isomerase family mycothiol-dependent enzyme [Pseudarthrobacter sp. NIBRBAC000502772]
MVARYDLVEDPQIKESLLLARRGTAYFSRQLAQLTAQDIGGPSLLSGWSRGHVVAHVGYNARYLAHLLEEVRRSETEVKAANHDDAHDIDYGATLPDAALRNLHAHAAVHLNVEWRDLPDDKWDTSLEQEGQRPLHVADTVWGRAFEVWVHAVDLNTGARFEDLPPQLLDRLFRNVMDDWDDRSDEANEQPQLLLQTTERADIYRLTCPAEKLTAVFEKGAMPRRTLTVEGTLAALTRWGLGRGTLDVRSPAGSVPGVRPRKHDEKNCPFLALASLVKA